MSQANLPNRILIVDDDPAVAQRLEEPLGKYDIKIDKATTVETALYLFNQKKYEVCLLELEFAPLPGLALVQKWRKHEIIEKTCTAFVMMSGNMTVGTNNEALLRELGDLETIVKPFGVIQLLPYLSRGFAANKRFIAYRETRSKTVDFCQKTGELDKAVKAVEKQAAAMGTRGVDMLFELYEKAQRYGDALVLVNGMLERDAANISLLNAKGRLLMRLGKFTEAKDVLAKSDTLAPQNIDRINELATAYLQLKDPVNATKKFREVLELTPEKPDLKFEMFSQLYNHGFDDHAVKFGRDVAQPMEIVRHYNNKGVVLSKEGNVDQALLEYQRALRFFPKFRENYRIYFNIALANLQTKTSESVMEAHAALKTCLELSPDFDKAKAAMLQVEKLVAIVKKKAG